MLRWQLVKGYNNPYLTHYGQRIYLSDILRTSSEKDNRIVGWAGICNTCSYIIRERWHYGEQQFAVTIE